MTARTAEKKVIVKKELYAETPALFSKVREVNAIPYKSKNDVAYGNDDMMALRL